MEDVGKQIDAAPPRTKVFTPKPQRGPPNKAVASASSSTNPVSYQVPGTSRSTTPGVYHTSYTPRTLNPPRMTEMGNEGVNRRLDKLITCIERQNNILTNLAAHTKEFIEINRGECPS